MWIMCKIGPREQDLEVFQKRNGGGGGGGGGEDESGTRDEK